MQKKLAILLAFFIVFSPVYSNAVLPALAASVASNGGRVLVGQTIKKVAPSALANARKAAVGICSKYPKLCGGGMGALGLSLTADGWNIEITNTDVNNIDVDIYKIPPNDACEVKLGWSAMSPSQSSFAPSSFKVMDDKEYEVVVQRNKHRGAEIIRYPAYAQQAKGIYDAALVAKYQTTIEWSRVGYSNIKPVFEISGWGLESSYSADLYYKCLPYPSNKTYITNYELNEYFTNNTVLVYVKSF